MQPSDISLLIAESDAPMRIALVNQLQAVGFRSVRGAANGVEAMQMMMAEPVQLIVSELDMPYMNGLALLETMRTDERTQGVPFVLMSGGLDRQSAEQAIRLGIGDLLIKPFTTKRLFERMLKVLKRERTTGAGDEKQEDRATILVVDDTPDNLQLIAGLFRDQFKVKLAHSGEKAIAICQSDSPPDLILLDVMMPVMDGFEVATRLRKHYASEQTPIIFVTAMTDSASRERGLNLGAVDYVTKPIDPPLLKLRVRNLMRHVEHRKQLQLDFDRMREIAQLRGEIEQLMRRDLTQPLLTALSSMQKLNLDPSLNPAQQQLAAEAEDATSQTLEMISLSSELMQIEAGQLKPKSDALPIARLVADLSGMLQRRYSRRGIRISVSPGDGQNLQARGDATLCHSMIYSLLRFLCDAAHDEASIDIAITGNAPICVNMTLSNPLAEAVRQQLFDKPNGSLSQGIYAARQLARVQGGDILLADHAPGTRLIVNLPAA